MAWFFRVVEREDGGWACRHGRTEYDNHAEYDAAVAHMTALASEHRPAEVIVHPVQGPPHTVAVLDLAHP